MNQKRPFYELPLAYPMHGLPEADVVRDVAYLDGGEDSPRLDLYRPPGEKPSGGFPLVLLLHGGPLPTRDSRPWPKEWRVFQDYGRLLAASGLAAAVINHRYTGYEGLLRAITDALAARQFLATHGAGYDLDGARCVLWAFSGAGMLLSPFLRGETSGLAGVIAFYPMLDLTHVQQALAVFSEEELIALSPLSHVEMMPSLLPLILVRAGLDREGLNRALDSFVKTALYHNRAVELHNLPRANHGFDMFDDRTAGEDAIRRAVEFAKSRLSGVAGQPEN